MSSSRSWWASPLLHAALLAGLVVGVYSNNFHHEFQLDDLHTLASNPSIRTLENIPRFFADPSTFTTLRANVDYRPVLLTTFALNYWMGGYNTWWWHLTQLLLHIACALGLYALCRKVIRTKQGEADAEPYATWVPLVVAAVFAVHPTASGVVNYLSARSSLLTDALLYPSIVLYMIRRDDARYKRIPWLTALLFALAIFTKVEAIAALAVYFLWDVWATAIAGKHQRRLLADIFASLNTTTFKRLSPMLGIAVVYFVVRHQVMAPFALDQTRGASGVTSLQYLMTETVVWWQYLFNWFAPLNLVADNGNYPVYTSLADGPVRIAVIGWLAVGGALFWNWKRRPYLAFLAFSALALISPTSSIAPLAEMLNEHRPYIPVAVASLCWMIPIGIFAVTTAKANRAVAMCWGVAFTAILIGYGTLTWQRNWVFSTQRAYLQDVVAKAPSGRALMNYGLVFMKDGDYVKALDYFNQAAVYSPQWHFVHTNLGIAYARTGQPDEALKHYTLGVELDQYSGTALTWRGNYYLDLHRYAEAARDFEESSKLSLELYRNAKGLATAYAGMGDAARSFEYTSKALAVDSAQAVGDAVAISTPFFIGNQFAAAGITYFEMYDKVLPNTWWIHANIGTLAGRLGDSTRMKAEQARSEALKGRK